MRSRAERNVFRDFFNSEKAGGIVLIACTLLAMLLANSRVSDSFIHFWHTAAPLHIGSFVISFNIEEWINDGLMTVFFLMVGLEIERELYIGELSSAKNAILPVFAAIGGMAIPALIHLVFTYGKPEAAGNGIPTATDIAFSLGILSLVGKRIPLPLKIFLTALAIFDDLGAIIIIGIFYTKSFSFFYLILALLVFIILLFLNKRNVMTLWVYLPAGLLIWYFLFRSGVHPTLSGVLLAFAIPFRNNKEKQLSAILQHALHKPVNFVIIPLFALANTAIHLPQTWRAELFSPNSLGISLGLLLGKPVGIVVFSMTAVAIGFAKLPAGMNLKKLAGLGILAGIGFTMSIFISNLAFPGDPDKIQSSKIAVLVASVIAALLGWLILKIEMGKNTNAGKSIKGESSL